MDLALSTEEADLAAAVAALLVRESPPERVRAAEDSGFDPVLWKALRGIGIPELAAGPGAATALQLTLIAEEAGLALASAPVVESLAAARLLARCGGPDAAELARACAASSVATLVLHPVAGGRAPLVPAGAVADVVLYYDGSRLRAARTVPPPPVRNLGSLPLADLSLPHGRGLSALAGGERGRALFEDGRRDWQLLTAAQLVGVAARALDLGVSYVREREVFGRPVATFQTVAHRLADHATGVDGARLLVREAACAVDSGDPRGAALTAMAFCFAAELAAAVAGDSLHFHGDYGFSLDYDIQLYYRRAQAVPLVWGSVQGEYQRVADLLYGRAA
ncbi:acyl-CoA dehydrogenase family protein [Actinocorallia aurea]